MGEVGTVLHGCTFLVSEPEPRRAAAYRTALISLGGRVVETAAGLVAATGVAVRLFELAPYLECCKAAEEPRVEHISPDWLSLQMRSRSLVPPTVSPLFRPLGGPPAEYTQGDTEVDGRYARTVVCGGVNAMAHTVIAFAGFASSSIDFNHALAMITRLGAAFGGCTAMGRDQEAGFDGIWWEGTTHLVCLVDDERGVASEAAVMQQALALRSKQLATAPRRGQASGTAGATREGTSLAPRAASNQSLGAAQIVLEVLHLAWLEDCVREWRRLPEHGYRLGMEELSRTIETSDRSVDCRTDRRRGRKDHDLPAQDGDVTLDAPKGSSKRMRKAAARAKAIRECEDALRAVIRSAPPPPPWMMPRLIEAEFAANSNAHGKAFRKLMLPSHISGGYWLQLPREMTAYMPEHDVPIILNAGNSSWMVQYLRREGNSNAGLSGGWRGFAIDQRLCAQDIVVFVHPNARRPRSLKPGEALQLHVVLFRKGTDVSDRADRSAYEFVRLVCTAAGSLDQLRKLPHPSPFTPEAVHTHSEQKKRRNDIPSLVQAKAKERAQAAVSECFEHAAWALGLAQDGEAKRSSSGVGWQDERAGGKKSSRRRNSPDAAATAWWPDSSDDDFPGGDKDQSEPQGTTAQRLTRDVVDEAVSDIGARAMAGAATEARQNGKSSRESGATSGYSERQPSARQTNSNPAPLDEQCPLSQDDRSIASRHEHGSACSSANRPKAPATGHGVPASIPPITSRVASQQDTSKNSLQENPARIRVGRLRRIVETSSSSSSDSESPLPSTPAVVMAPASTSAPRSNRPTPRAQGDNEEAGEGQDVRRTIDVPSAETASPQAESTPCAVEPTNVGVTLGPAPIAADNSTRDGTSDPLNGYNVASAIAGSKRSGPREVVEASARVVRVGESEASRQWDSSDEEEMEAERARAAAPAAAATIQDAEPADGLPKRGRGKRSQATKPKALRWKKHGHPWIKQMVRRFCVDGPEDARITKWVAEGNNPIDEPALWHIVYADSEEEDLEESQVVDGLLAHDLKMQAQKELDDLEELEKYQNHRADFEGIPEIRHHCRENETPKQVAAMYEVSLPLLLLMNITSQRDGSDAHLNLKSSSRASKHGFWLNVPPYRIDGNKTTRPIQPQKPARHHKKQRAAPPQGAIETPTPNGAVVSADTVAPRAAPSLRPPHGDGVEESTTCTSAAAGTVSARAAENLSPSLTMARLQPDAQAKQKEMMVPALCNSSLRGESEMPANQGTLWSNGIAPDASHTGGLVQSADNAQHAPGSSDAASPPSSLTSGKGDAETVGGVMAVGVKAVDDCSAIASYPVEEEKENAPARLAAHGCKCPSNARPSHVGHNPVRPMTSVASASSRMVTASCKGLSEIAPSHLGTRDANISPKASEPSRSSPFAANVQDPLVGDMTMAFNERSSVPVPLCSLARALDASIEEQRRERPSLSTDTSPRFGQQPIAEPRAAQASSNTTRPSVSGPGSPVTPLSSLLAEEPDVSHVLERPEGSVSTLAIGISSVVDDAPALIVQPKHRDWHLDCMRAVSRPYLATQGREPVAAICGSKLRATDSLEAHDLQKDLGTIEPPDLRDAHVEAELEEHSAPAAGIDCNTEWDHPAVTEQTAPSITGDDGSAISGGEILWSVSSPPPMPNLEEAAASLQVPSSSGSELPRTALKSADAAASTPSTRVGERASAHFGTSRGGVSPPGAQSSHSSPMATASERPSPIVQSLESPLRGRPAAKAIDAPPVIQAVGGREDDPIRARIRALAIQLGGEYVATTAFDPRCTHMVLVQPKRSEKLLAALAAGLWLLNPDWIDASAKGWANEEDYEVYALGLATPLPEGPLR